MASNGIPIFYSAISRVFDSWTALQLAIQHGFGGINSVEKSKWMVDAVYQWFQDNKDIEYFELEDFIGAITNNEFDMVAEDGSLTCIAKSICKHYAMCSNGKGADVLKELETLPKAAIQNSVQKPDIADEGDDLMECYTPSDIVSEMQQLDLITKAGPASMNNGQSELNDTNMQTKDKNIDEDRWSIVVKKGKKR